MGEPLPPEQLCFAAAAREMPAKTSVPLRLVATATAPAAPTEVDSQEHVLQLRRRWHIGVAVGLLLVAALVGLAMWSFVTPHGSSAADDQATTPATAERPPSAE
jgi:hypothetical protein